MKTYVICHIKASVEKMTSEAENSKFIHDKIKSLHLNTILKCTIYNKKTNTDDKQTNLANMEVKQLLNMIKSIF